MIDARRAGDTATLEPGSAPDATPWERAVDGASGPRPGQALGAADRAALVKRYAHLVKYVVGRLGVSVPGVFDHEDAMQAGVIGLLRAIDGFRPDTASSFESYALVRIRGSILDAVRALDSVGRAGRTAGRQIATAIRELEIELGRSPAEAEVASRLGLTREAYRDRLQAATVVTVSLDEPDPHDDDGPGGASTAAQAKVDETAVDPEAALLRQDLVRQLALQVASLPGRQQTVLSLYYQDGLTLKEIGEVLGVTESRVSQIHAESVLTLRARLVDPDVAARLGRRRSRR